MFGVSNGNGEDTKDRSAKKGRMEGRKEEVKIVRNKKWVALTLDSVKNGVFWDVTPYDSYKNRRFGGPHCLYNHGDKNHFARNVSSKWQRASVAIYC
jgi:hypothetical protein